MNTIYNLIKKLYNDDIGGIVTAEYLLLGAILGTGTITGMTTMRDMAIQDMVETGNSMKMVREMYSPQFRNTNQPKPTHNVTDNRLP